MKDRILDGLWFDLGLESGIGEVAMAMMSVQGDVRQHQQQPQLALSRATRAPFGSDRDDSFVLKSEPPSSLVLGSFKGPDSREG